MSASLKNLPNFVTDAYRITPQNAFKPENIVIGSYTFLPWVRGGVGAVVNTPAAGLRATVDVAVPVQADGQADLQAGTTVHVRGPGDVLGLDERQIIRRYPLPEATDAEDTFLAHVEFDRPVIPWLFSPTAAGGDRLVPWIALVVLEQGRYQLRPGSQGRPDQVATFLGELQPTDDAWAWAHAQLIGTPDTVPDPADQPSVDDRLTAEYGQANLSRLLCPRKLDPQRQYLACVVPLYNAGVAAGLGEPPPANLAMAWTRAADGADTDTAITLPLYTSWRFATGADGDFASLAEKLHGVAAPWQIGRRLTATSTPGGGLPPLADGDPGQLQTIHGPVYSPNAPDPKSPNPTEVAAVTAETASWPATETEALRTELNRPYELARRTASPDDPVPRPVVGPEIYARYQAAAARVEPSRDADWFGQLNLRPEHRVAAGLGTRVVQMDQEQLMQSAWAQVGEIDAANRSLRWVQLARFVGTASYERHITPLAFGDLLAATRRVQSRVLAQPVLTVAADVAKSNLADAAVSSAFRRVTRPLGGLARFVAADPSGQGRLVAEDGTARDMQRPYQELDGVAGVSSAAAAALDPQRVAAALGVDVSGVPAALAAAGTALDAQPALIDITDEHVRRTTPDPGDYAVFAGKQLLSHLRQGLKQPPGKNPAWSASAASLALAVQTIPELANAAREIAAELMRGINAEPQPQQELVGILQNAREATPDSLRQGFTAIGDDLVAPDWPATALRPGLGITSPSLVALVDPAVNLTARVKARFGASRPSWLPPDWFDDLLLNPVMAAPVFTRPMYEALDAYSRDWLLPGLGKFAEPDIVTTLQSNARFIEAFLGGLSHEMGRELLWRGYPTDQRGTYFRRFWDRTKDDLAQDLARFTTTPLGSHVVPTLDGRVVLLVRGQLIRRYPHAIVLAMFADRLIDGVPEFGDPGVSPGVLAGVPFHGHLPPDIKLVGFDLTIDKIRGDAQGDAGWWFVISEHPTAPRFGLAQNSTGPTRDGLAWGDLNPLRLARFLATSPTKVVHDSPDRDAPHAIYGADAASTAHVLLRDPFRAAFRAIDMLTTEGSPA
jgi:hypothetical protein